MVSGIGGYANWDDPSTAKCESYQANVVREFVSPSAEPGHEYDSFDYAKLKEEVDAGRPVMLSVYTKILYPSGSVSGRPHSVLAYGYRDDMFSVLLPGTSQVVTVGGFAVRHTWSANDIGGRWKGPNGEDLNGVIDADGVIWWPFIPYGGIHSFSDRQDWMVRFGITVDIAGWIRGDANLDSRVDDADLSYLLAHWGSVGLWEDGDFNDDSFIDDRDLSFLLSNWAMGCPVAVPEPLTGALIAVGLLTMNIRKRSR